MTEKTFTKPEGFGVGDTPEQKALREEAKQYGLKFRGRPKAEKMRAMIDEYLANQNKPEPVHVPEPVVQASESPVEAVTAPTPSEPPPLKLKPGEKLYYTQEEWDAIKAKEARRNIARLVRCRITCMNPNKKNWTGEIVSVGSAKAGTFKKFIPFNLEEPYHIPQIIFEHLKERKCAIRNIRKTPDGREEVDVKLIPEFAIEVLPPLTKAELEDLKRRQAMARGTV